MQEIIPHFCWDNYDTEVLRCKMRTAEKKASELERMSHNYRIRLQQHCSREALDPRELRKTAKKVQDISERALDLQYPTKNIEQEFNLLASQSTQEWKKLAHIQRGLLDLQSTRQTTRPDSLKVPLKRFTLISNIRLTRSIYRAFQSFDIAASLYRQLSETMQQTLNRRYQITISETMSHANVAQRITSVEELPNDFDKLEEAAKKLIIYQGRELKITGQPRSVLVYLICTYPTKKSALDIESVITSEKKQDIKLYQDNSHGDKDEDEKRVRDKISNLCYRVEKAIKAQSQIDDWSEDPTSSDRPIQRQKDHEGRSLYSLNPKLSHLISR